MEFSAGAFDTVLSGPLGQAFGYRRASRCPCFSSSSGAAAPSCPICMGKGWMWAPEVTLDCYAGMTNQSQQKAFAAFGEWQPGDAQLTIPCGSALYGAGHMDRFRCLDATTPFSEGLVHDGSDVLLGTVQSLAQVCWIDPADPSQVIQGGLPRVSATGALTWTSGEPPEGASYAISGVRWTEFFAYLALPAMRNIGQVQGLPKKLPVRRFDLFGR